MSIRQKIKIHQVWYMSKMNREPGLPGLFASFFACLGSFFPAFKGKSRCTSEKSSSLIINIRPSKKGAQTHAIPQSRAPPRLRSSGGRRTIIKPLVMLQVSRHSCTHGSISQRLRPLIRLSTLQFFGFIFALVFVGGNSIVPGMYRTRAQPMIPAIPRCGCDDGSTGMPTGVSDNGLPYTTPSIVVVAIDEPLIRQRSAALGRLQDIDGASFRAIEVPNVDLSIVGSRINVSGIRGGRRTEVTAN